MRASNQATSLRSGLGYVPLTIRLTTGGLRSQFEEFITKDELAQSWCTPKLGPAMQRNALREDDVVALVLTDPPAHSAAFDASAEVHPRAPSRSPAAHRYWVLSSPS